MKNIKWVVIAFLSVFVYAMPGNLNASFPVVSESIVPGSDALNKLKASEFVKLSLKDISRLTGKKLSLKEKISFSVMNKRMKHAIKKDSNLTVKDYLAADHKLGLGWKIFFIILGLMILMLIIFAIELSQGGF